MATIRVSWTDVTTYELTFEGELTGDTDTDGWTVTDAIEEAIRTGGAAINDFDRDIASVTEAP